ncbi:hypothetical protein BC835DRAFT_228358 [Cytidiella melzeri]|nr:hypothetical protein BC835DRAFT_228358 [Cytidiella melzeri]
MLKDCLVKMLTWEPQSMGQDPGARGGGHLVSLAVIEVPVTAHTAGTCAACMGILHKALREARWILCSIEEGVVVCWSMTSLRDGLDVRAVRVHLCLGVRLRAPSTGKLLFVSDAKQASKAFRSDSAVYSTETPLGEKVRRADRKIRRKRPRITGTQRIPS